MAVLNTFYIFTDERNLSFKVVKPASACFIFWICCDFGGWLRGPRLGLGLTSRPLRVGGAFLEDLEESVDSALLSSEL